MRLRFAVPAVATALAATGLVMPAAHAAPAPDITVTATADAYVSHAQPTVAKGTTDPTNCSVNDDTGNEFRCLTQFVVAGLGAGDTVTGAELRIVDKGDAAGSKLVNLTKLTAGFAESTVTWNNAPTWAGAPVASQTAHAFGQDSVFTLPAGTVSGNGTVAFVMWSPANSYPTGMNFQTKDNTVGKLPPRLVLHVDHQSTPAAALTVTPNSGVSPLAVTADASGSSDPDADITSYGFDWGDGTTTPAQAAATAGHTYSTAGAYTATVTVTDAGGRTSTATAAVDVTAPPPPPPPAPTRNGSVYGANVHQLTGETFTQALAREDSASSYGPLTLRLFFTGLPSTSCTDPRNAAANDRPSTVSFKDAPADVSSGSDDATINAWLGCFTRPTQVTYYHEMEDNFPAGTAAAQWVQAWRHFSDLVDAHPNRANLLKTIIYGDYTWLPASGRDYLTWWPGDSYVDVLGADQYGFLENDGTTANDQTEATHQAARPSYAAAVAHGKPYTVPELGYDDPATRPGFLSSVGSWLKDPGRNVTLVQYFDGGNDTTPQPGNHRLLDQASVDAWRAVIHS